MYGIIAAMQEEMKEIKKIMQNIENKEIVIKHILNNLKKIYMKNSFVISSFNSMIIQIP